MSKNLSQEGSCWIYDQAICCERAVVERSAGLFQEAIAKGDALLTGTAVMYQTSIAEESCRILAGEVWNMAHIRGFAKITAAKETGDAPLILGNSLVFGKCMRESIGERKCSAKPECGESDTGAVSFQGR